MTFVLGIETSCDDTAAALVRRSASGEGSILANIVWAQHERHSPFGGVVPEIAARSHVERLDHVISQALEESGHILADIDAIAATAGPGLVGGVMVGLTAAKGLAIGAGKPLIPINHLEAHALSVRMTEYAPFPYLLLLISGGHTLLVLVKGLGEYERLGATIDDAAGEAFDKTGKLLGLGLPGGPHVEKAAREGRADRFRFPAPLARRDGCDFSLSGLKTAVRLAAESIPNPTAQDIADIAAAFQAALARHLATRTERAMNIISRRLPEARRLVVAGGVAANGAVRSSLLGLCESWGWSFISPPAEYCTDNGAMVAWAGAERLASGLAPPPHEAMAFAPRARWPLAPPPDGREIGGGRKGPKA